MALLQDFRNKKLTIGMVYTPPFSTSLKKDRRTLQEVVSHCVYNAKALHAAGFDSVLLQNVGDEPCSTTADPSTVAFMSIVGREIKNHVDIRLGINLLDHDGKAPIAVANACGADFVRLKVFVGTMVKMTGTLNGIYYDSVRYRRDIRAENVEIFADIFDREGYPVGATDVEEMAHFAVYSCMADGLIITGKNESMTIEWAEKVRALKQAPVIIGGGVRPENIRRLAECSDGFIIGNYLLENPADDFSLISPEKCEKILNALHCGA